MSFSLLELNHKPIMILQNLLVIHHFTETCPNKLLPVDYLKCKTTIVD